MAVGGRLRHSPGPEVSLALQERGQLCPAQCGGQRCAAGAEGGWVGGRSRARPGASPPPPTALSVTARGSGRSLPGAALYGVAAPRFVLPVRAVPHKTISLEDAAAAACALRIPAGGSREREASMPVGLSSARLACSAGGCGDKSPQLHRFSVFALQGRADQRPASSGSPCLHRGNETSGVRLPCAARALLHN